MATALVADFAANAPGNAPGNALANPLDALALMASSVSSFSNGNNPHKRKLENDDDKEKQDHNKQHKAINASGKANSKANESQDKKENESQDKDKRRKLVPLNACSFGVGQEASRLETMLKLDNDKEWKTNEKLSPEIFQTMMRNRATKCLKQAMLSHRHDLDVAAFCFLNDKCDRTWVEWLLMNVYQLPMSMLYGVNGPDGKTSVYAQSFARWNVTTAMAKQIRDAADALPLMASSASSSSSSAHDKSQSPPILDAQSRIACLSWMACLSLMDTFEVSAIRPVLKLLWKCLEERDLMDVSASLQQPPKFSRYWVADVGFWQMMTTDWNICAALLQPQGAFAMCPTKEALVSWMRYQRVATVQEFFDHLQNARCVFDPSQVHLDPFFPMDLMNERLVIGGRSIREYRNRQGQEIKIGSFELSLPLLARIPHLFDPSVPLWGQSIKFFQIIVALYSRDLLGQWLLNNRTIQLIHNRLIDPEASAAETQCQAHAYDLAFLQAGWALSRTRELMNLASRGEKRWSDQHKIDLGKHLNQVYFVTNKQPAGVSWHYQVEYRRMLQEEIQHDSYFPHLGSACEKCLVAGGNKHRLCDEEIVDLQDLAAFVPDDALSGLIETDDEEDDQDNDDNDDDENDDTPETKKNATIAHKLKQEEIDGDDEDNDDDQEQDDDDDEDDDEDDDDADDED